MSFTAAYLYIDATYLVPASSAVRTAAEVDREGCGWPRPRAPTTSCS